MAPHQTGPFCLELPQGWRDETTVLLKGPVREGMQARLHMGPPVRFRETLTVSREPLPEGVDDAATYLSALQRTLRTTGVDVDVVATRPITIAGAPGVCEERRVRLGDNVNRQLCAAVRVGDDVVVATATTAESQAELRRGELELLIGSIRIP